MDNVDPVFRTLLDWPSFSLSISEVRWRPTSAAAASLVCRGAAAPVLACAPRLWYATAVSGQMQSAVQADVHRLPELLQAVPPEHVRHKQAALSQVWRRFMYSSYSFFPGVHVRNQPMTAFACIFTEASLYFCCDCPSGCRCPAPWAST